MTNEPSTEEAQGWTAKRKAAVGSILLQARRRQWKWHTATA